MTKGQMIRKVAERFRPSNCKVPAIWKIIGSRNDIEVYAVRGRRIALVIVDPRVVTEPGGFNRAWYDVQRLQLKGTFVTGSAPSAPQASM